MINPARNLTLVSFRGSEGDWVPYALNPPGPSPIKCSSKWEWCAVQNGKLYRKAIGKKQFTAALEARDE